MLMALGIYICYRRQRVQETSQVCDVVGKAPCLSISWPGVGVVAGGRCLESAKAPTPLMLDVLVSDQFSLLCFRVECGSATLILLISLIDTLLLKVSEIQESPENKL